MTGDFLTTTEEKVSALLTYYIIAYLFMIEKGNAKNMNIKKGDSVENFIEVNKDVIDDIRTSIQRKFDWEATEYNIYCAVQLFLATGISKVPAQ